MIDKKTMGEKKKLVFATNNAHKLRELREILGTGYELLSLADIGCHEDIPEDGATLEENSLAKAQYVFDHYGYDCFADDTGLEVDALGGEPGVHSARYAEGTDHDSEANMRKLLAKLGNNNNRKARFRTVITLIRGVDNPSAPPRKYFLCGEIDGSIAFERRGTEGFDYDSIFIPEGYDKTFAELGENVKNQISHRGRSVRKLVAFLIPKILHIGYKTSN